MTMFPGLLLLLLAVPMISAATDRPCVPDKMTGNMDTGLHSSEYMKHVFDVGKFQIDFTAQKVMVYELDKMPVVKNILVDFGNSKKFIRMKDGSCEVSDFRHLNGLQRCVPYIAHDWNKALRVKNSDTWWWSFSLNNVFTSVSDFRIEKSSSLPTRIGLRWDTNDWPYQWDFSNITTSVPADSALYQDTSDCVKG